MICIPITEATHREALRAIKKSAPAADAIELRMDLIAGGKLPQLMAAARRASGQIKIIVTCRRKEESLIEPLGYPAKRKTEMTQTAKLSLLRQAVLLGAEFIDVELACGEKTIRQLQSLIRRQKSPTRLIVSWHNISKTPSQRTLKAIFQDCRRAGADIVKMVPYARNAEDNIKVLNLIDHARKQDVKIIAMCSGAKGQISRVLAPHKGSYLEFAVLPDGKKSAPGQLTLNTMRQFQNLLKEHQLSNRLGLLNKDASNFVLLGNPVRQSLSPLMHNKALDAMRLDGHYSAFRVDDLAAAMTGIRGMNIRGASVTIPFKMAVMDYLDDIDADADALGAVNTIVNERGRLIGHNTDWLGLMQALKSEMSIKGKTFVILGAGGTARAAAYGIKKEGGRPVIVNRTPEKGRALAEKLNCPFFPLADIGKIKAPALINTTPVGMYPKIHSSPMEAAILSHYRVVADVIYNPLKTKLLRDAEAKGCRIISGLEMFVRQGAAQLKLWTGREAPLALMRKIIQERLEKREA